jgi:HSP20 family protein
MSKDKHKKREPEKHSGTATAVPAVVDVLDRPVRRLSDLLRWPDWSSMVVEHPIAIEEFRDGDDLVVRAEVPGIDPDRDVDIRVSDRTLHLRVERREEKKSDTGNGYRTEFHYGSFTRSVPLGAGVTAKDVTAAYHDGILTVHMPVNTQMAQAERIPIART